MYGGLVLIVVVIVVVVVVSDLATSEVLVGWAQCRNVERINDKISSLM